MAAPEPASLESAGPFQQRRGAKGQYVYWITMPYPTPEAIAAHSLKTPEAFDRQSFIDFGVQVHNESGVQLEEAACFKEPHEDGRPHLNLVVRAATQFKWKAVADKFREKGVYVNFAPNIKTWMDGVVYGKVASEHKGAERLDPEPQQWKREGQPTPLEEFLPKQWRQSGFVRQTRLTNLAFFDLCVQHGVQTETELWAKATQLSEQGDRAMLAYLLEHDGEGQLGKVLKATAAKERVRRKGLSREALLEEFVANKSCTCEEQGHCFTLMKDLLRKNGLEGTFQKEVLGALRSGRAKMRNICLVGAANCGKSFLLEGLLEVFHTYVRPDGGSHQLEDVLDKELVFLNDFEYDAAAKEWMTWQYLKNFLEGAAVTVSRPKNKGGNVSFKDKVPVFLTAPREVALYRYGREVAHETKQMQKRIRYLELSYEVPDEERKEVLHVCGHCSARVYLEGRSLLDHNSAGEPAQEPQQPQEEEEQRPPKRQRTARDCLAELQSLKALFDNGALTQQEFADLKTRLLKGE